MALGCGQGAGGHLRASRGGATLAIRPVRAYRRSEQGRPQQVGAYRRGVPSGIWIPRPGWLRGQRTFAARGEAIWEHSELGRRPRLVVRRPQVQKTPAPAAPRARHREITKSEARGNSRPVSSAEFQRLADAGRDMLSAMRRESSPAEGLDRSWDAVKDRTYAAVREPWGGATIDAHTGDWLADGADKYALTVRPQDMDALSVPETASRQDWEQAMDAALEKFRPALERRGFYLGVFHDDDEHRIDIDPVAVVDTPEQVEQLGAYTHAVGGAYHFKTGDGYFPPHVEEQPPD